MCITHRWYLFTYKLLSIVLKFSGSWSEFFSSINNAGLLNYSLMSRILKMAYWDCVTFMAFCNPFSFLSFLFLLLHIQTHVMHPWRMLLSRCHSKLWHDFNQGLKKLKHSTNYGFKVEGPQQISTWRATSWIHSHFFSYWWQFGNIFPTFSRTKPNFHFVSLWMCTSDRMSWGNDGDFLLVAQMVENGVRNVKIMSLIPKKSKNALDWLWGRKKKCLPNASM